MSETYQECVSDDLLDELVDNVLKETLVNNSAVDIIKKIGSNVVDERNLGYVSNLIYAKIREAYLLEDVSYFLQLRAMYVYIIKSVIKKSFLIVGNGKFDPDVYDIDYLMVLYKQNELSSKIDDGFVWVLNTSVMIVYDYNSNLIKTNYYFE